MVQVELILQASTPGLQKNGKIRVASDGFQQGLGPKTIQPEGQAPLKIPARKPQGPAGVFSEFRSKEPALLQGLSEQPFQVFRRYQGQDLCPDGKVLGQPRRKCRRYSGSFQGGRELLLPGRLEGQAERSVDLTAPEGMQDNRPFVLGIHGSLEVFDQQVMPVWEFGPGRFLLSFRNR